MLNIDQSIIYLWQFMTMITIILKRLMNFAFRSFEIEHTGWSLFEKLERELTHFSYILFYNCTILCNLYWFTCWNHPSVNSLNQCSFTTFFLSADAFRSFEIEHTGWSLFEKLVWTVLDTFLCFVFHPNFCDNHIYLRIECILLKFHKQSSSIV
jgi:hypothetical protein